MQITALTKQKRNNEYVNVFLDEKYWISLSINQILEYKISKGVKIDNDLKLKLEKISSESKILSRLEKYLYKRPRSEREIKQYLKNKVQVDSAGIDKITSKIKNNLKEFYWQSFIPDYKETNLQSWNQKFSYWYIFQRLQFKTYGINKIKSELFQKGVSSKDASQILALPKINQLKNKNIENKLTTEINKELKKYKELDFKTKQKIIRKFMSRGYAYAEVKEALA